MTLEARVAAPAQAELLTSPGVKLLVERVVRLALNDLAGPEAQRLSARTPLAALRLPVLGSVDAAQGQRLSVTDLFCAKRGLWPITWLLTPGSCSRRGT